MDGVIFATTAWLCPGWSRLWRPKPLSQCIGYSLMTPVVASWILTWPWRLSSKPGRLPANRGYQSQPGRALSAELERGESAYECRCTTGTASGAHCRGMPVVAAAGNEGRKKPVDPQVPAKWKDYVISVAAIDRYLVDACFSNPPGQGGVKAPGGNGVDITVGAVVLKKCQPALDACSGPRCILGLISQASADWCPSGYAYWAGTSFARAAGQRPGRSVSTGKQRQSIRVEGRRGIREHHECHPR